MTQPDVQAGLPVERDANGVVTLTLTQPDRPVVVLNRALLQAVDEALDRIEAEGGMTGFVLASGSSRVYIAGADLNEIIGLDDAGLEEYLSFGQRVYGRIATLGVTTVAAVNGAVLGGGLEIAMHCDVLLASEPAEREGVPGKAYQVGLPEAGLHICPGWGGTNLLPARMDAATAMRMTATGRTFTHVEAHEAGLFEALVKPGELLARARERAATPKHSARTQPVCLSDVGEGGPGHDAARLRGYHEALDSVAAELAHTSQAARAVLNCVSAGLENGWFAALDLERRELIRLRSTPEGSAAIRSFFERSSGKPAKS